ncbi:hypothetical protein HZS_1848, partial [Henneguya salminicola]
MTTKEKKENREGGINLTFHTENNKSFYAISKLPYILLLIPLIMGCMISLFSKDKYIRLYFPSGFFGQSKVHETLWAFTAASFPLGGCIGTFFATSIGSKWGRKFSTLLFVAIGLISTALLFVAFFGQSYTAFFASRFLQGIGSGGIMNIGLIYLYELIPVKRQKLISLLLQPLINLGILVSGIFSMEFIVGSNWALTAIPLTILLITSLIIVIFLPESPFYTYQKSPTNIKTQEILFYLYNGDRHLMNQAFETISKKTKDTKSCETISFKDFITNKDLLGPIIVTTLIAVLQQLSGINIVIFYLSEFIQAAKFDNIDLGNVIMFFVCFAGSVIFAGVIPFTGSKIMMIIGFSGMALSFGSAYTVHYLVYIPILTVIFLSLFLFWFQCGPGPKPWCVFNDTFSPEYQASAQGYLTFNNWTANFLITAFFPFVLNAIGFHSVILFAIANGFFAILIAVLMIETKGK